MSEESNRGFISLFPEVPGRKTKRIVVLDGRVAVRCKGFQVGLRRLQLCGSGKSTGAGKGSNRSGGGKENRGSGLHGGYISSVGVVL